MSSVQSRNVVPPLMNLVRFRGLPILKQLHIEENLLRTSSENWCIINDGAHDPTIVMGISGLAAELVEIGAVLRDDIPVIRRFTGGGTVTVDRDTVFVTLICNKEAIAELQPYPRPIMSWSGNFYAKVFQGIGDFNLRENDYVFGDRKFGGNAQSITKNRWIHHTSFLWDYDVRNMAYLRHPKKVPNYRLARDHLEFICRMKEYMPRSEFIDSTVKVLKTDFSLKSIESDGLANFLDENFSPSTRVLTRRELENMAFASQIKNSARRRAGDEGSAPSKLSNPFVSEKDNIF